MMNDNDCMFCGHSAKNHKLSISIDSTKIIHDFEMDVDGYNTKTCGCNGGLVKLQYKLVKQES